MFDYHTKIQDRMDYSSETHNVHKNITELYMMSLFSNNILSGLLKNFS